VIVSAPALASTHLPAVSLAASPGKTNPFKNVFESLTLSDDPNQDGAQQEGASLPKSTAKKELPEQNSGTEEASVLPAPVVPQPPSQNLPKPSLMLGKMVQRALPEEATASPTSAGDQTDEKQPSLSYSSPAYSARSIQARLNVASVPLATQSTVAQKVPGQSSPSPIVKTAPPPALVAEALPVEPATAHAAATLPAARSSEVALRSTNLDSKPIAPKPQPMVAMRQVTPPQVSAPPIPVSATTVRTSTNVAPEKQTPVQARVKTPVGNTDPIALNVPAESSDTVAPASLPTAAQSGQSTQSAQPAQPRPVQAQALSPAPAPSPLPIATPVVPLQPDVPTALPPNATPPQPQREQVADSTVSSPAAPTTESTPEAVTAAPRVPLIPVPSAHETLDRPAPMPSGPSALPHEAASSIPASKAPLVPQAENFAFAVRMLGPETSSDQPSPALTESETPVTTPAAPVTPPSAPVTQPQSSDPRQPAPDRTQTSSDPSPATQPAAPETTRAAAAPQGQFELLATQPVAGVTPHWNDAAVWQAPQNGSTAGAQEPTEAAHPNLPLAAQEAHLSAPELPKTSASSEILLHLTSNDQTSAAIRVADRAGSVNVSVHASDPVLRETLRANLGDLSNQLSSQGWKADVVKSAAVATPPGSPQDSHAGEQRGSQQQSSGGERQSQRDRRANGGQWQQELDQQISGGDAHSGGNG
jgi:hypothetical protein